MLRVKFPSLFSVSLLDLHSILELSLLPPPYFSIPFLSLLSLSRHTYKQGCINRGPPQPPFSPDARVGITRRERGERERERGGRRDRRRNENTPWIDDDAQKVTKANGSIGAFPRNCWSFSRRELAAVASSLLLAVLVALALAASASDAAAIDAGDAASDEAGDSLLISIFRVNA